MVTPTLTETAPLTFLDGSPAEPAAVEHADFVRRYSAAAARVNALSNGVAEREARGADSAALAETLRTGADDPGQPAHAAWSADLADARRLYDALALAVIGAHRRAIAAAISAAPVMVSVLDTQRGNALTDLSAACDAAADALARVRSADHRASILRTLTTDGATDHKSLQWHPPIYARFPISAVTDDGYRHYMVAPDQLLAALISGATPRAAASTEDD